MWTRCLGGFSVMWVTKLLISPVMIKIFYPKTTQFGTKLAFLVILGQIFVFLAHWGSSLSSCLIWSSWSKCSWPRWSSWSRWSYGLDGHHGQDRQDRGDRQDRQSLKARQDITHIFAGGVLKDLQNRYDCHWVHPVHCIFLVNKKISFITFIFSKKLWSRTLYYIVCIWYLIDSKWFLF